MNDLIDAYFERDLTDQEKEALDLLLLTNSEVAADFEFQKKVRAGIIKLEREKSRVMLQSFEKKKENKVLAWKYIGIAASIILILTVSWYKYLVNGNNEKLYATYYQPLPNIESPIVRGKNVMDDKLLAFKYYESDQYREALKMFKELEKRQAGQYATFYKAICLLELGDIQQAGHILQTESFTDTEQSYASFAEWYLALCFLKLNEKESAVALLKKIGDSAGHPQQVQAIRLLGELE